MRKSYKELTQLAIKVRMRLLGNYPLPGDAVRLTGNYSVLKPGSIGIIGGIVGKPREGYDITFNASAFRGKSSHGPGPEYVSCSGGPGTIVTPAWKLVPTNEKINMEFWRWKDRYARKGNGETFMMFVPVFHWDGTND